MSPNDAVTNTGEELLRTIVGARLTSVQFVLNYLIVGFDAKGALTTLVWPEVSGGDRIVKFGMSTYRDRLCELITHHVTKVNVCEDETIVISFDEGSQIHIPLRSYELPGERAIFTTPDHRLHTW